MASQQKIGDDLKNKVEAVLFASGKNTDIEEISRLCREKDNSLIVKALEDLRSDYDKRNCSIVVLQEGTKWKLTVREAYIGIAKRLIADTELPKTVIETLAVIAWKNPVTQSDVIKIRTNKAYDHIDILEELGFLTRSKHGRTNMIKLTEKFFKYFELGGNKDIREVFKNIRDQEVKENQTKVDQFAEESPEKEIVEARATESEETVRSREDVIAEILSRAPPVGTDEISENIQTNKDESESEDMENPLAGEEKDETVDKIKKDTDNLDIKEADKEAKSNSDENQDLDDDVAIANNKINTPVTKNKEKMQQPTKHKIKHQKSIKRQ